jgi:hypothetical protein
MKCYWPLWACLLLLASCSLEPPPTGIAEQQIAGVPTPSSTPSATVLPRPSPTTIATTTSQPTTRPTATPSPTTTPTATPRSIATTESAPTSTPLSSPVALSYCRRTFGDADSTRFSTRIEKIEFEESAELFTVTIVFTDTNGPLHGYAECNWSDSWPRGDIGSQQAPGTAFIGLYLDNWAHDNAFEASLLTSTLSLESSNLVQGIAVSSNSLWSRGALLGIALPEPRPFDVRLEEERLMITIAQVAAQQPDDLLSQEQGMLEAPRQPIFFLQNGDLYRLESGQAQPITPTIDRETALAVSPDGTLLAICRAPQDADPFRARTDPRATLWIMRVDGDEQRQIADVGGCNDPSFDESGSLIAFTATNGSVSQIWTVPIADGSPQAVTSQIDEWSRHAPHWIGRDRLLYRATNENGQSILFLNSDGIEREVSAQMLTGSLYHGVGSFVVSHDASMIAVQALHDDGEGADLVVLRLDGSQIASERRGFLQQPLAFIGDELLYQTIECPSTTMHSYSLRRRMSQGRVETLLRGTTTQTISAMTVVPEGVLYIRTTMPQDTMSELANLSGDQTSSSIWLLSDDGSTRVQLYKTSENIEGIAVPPAHVQ